MKTLLSGMLLLVVLQLAAKPDSRLERNKFHNKILTQNNEPEVVSTLSDRDAIPMAFRNELMYCYVADNHKIYQLRGGVTNAHWVELDIASTLKIQGPAGSLPYIDASGLLATDLRYLGKSKYDFSGANSLGQGKYINANGVGNTINDKSHNILNSYNSYSDGSYNLIVGERDSVLGMNSTALGNDISLKQNNQFAAGLGLIAQSVSEAVFGQFNTTYNSSGNSWDPNDRLLTIGNGTSDANRSDAVIIYKDGDAQFNGELSAPNLYNKNQVDSLVINSSGGTGVVQSLNLNGTQLAITGSNSVNFNGWDTDASDDFSGDYTDLTNTPNFNNWDQDASDDFSGDYNDLTNKPTPFSGSYNDLTNTPNFSGWDQNAADDFSGDYSDLTNKPSFNGWDTDASDDFSGDFGDLTNVPNFSNWDQDASDDFSGDYTDLTNKPSFNGWDTDASDDFSGDFNDLTNTPNFAGWDQDASDDFSGNYNDLTNKPTLFSGNYSDLVNAPNFSGWDQNAADDFSGDYNDLINTPTLFSGDFSDLNNVPDLYSKTQVDSAISANAGSGGIAQNLSLTGNQLSISGGNNITFSNWDTDASDDFSGDYNDLTNAPNFAGWDQNAADDFSGNYNDLTNRPDFTNWDQDASDDFSGDFSDLNNAPDLYTKNQVDSAISANAGSGGIAQNLSLSGNQLSISGGNNITFNNWDTDVTDDFSGNYTDLTNVPADFKDGSISWNELTSKPALYTQAQVDSIRQNVVDSMTAYVDSAVISQAHSELLANRSLVIDDCGKTLYVKSNTSILTIPNNLNVPFNRHVELRDFGSGALILDASAVTLRDDSGNIISSGTASIIVQDAALTSIGNNEFKIIGLYQ